MRFTCMRAIGGVCRISRAASSAACRRFSRWARPTNDAPDLGAVLAAHATLTTLSDLLWRRADPTRADVDRVTGFCLRALRS